MNLAELDKLLDRPFWLLDAYVRFRRQPACDPFASCAALIEHGTHTHSVSKLDRRLDDLRRIDGLFRAASARNGRTPCAPEGAPIPPRRPGRPSKQGVQLRNPATVTQAEHATRREYERAHTARLSAHLHV